MKQMKQSRNYLKEWYFVRRNKNVEKGTRNLFSKIMWSLGRKEQGKRRIRR